MEKMTIGMFGTCGGSKWRDRFMKEYKSLGIPYFNPQKDNWKPEDAITEAEHLTHDRIILFPITNETYAFGSLGEVGFSILNAIKLNDNRDIIVMIDSEVKVKHENACIAELIMFEAQEKDSLRARTLVKAHLRNINHPNVYMVDNLADMLWLSIDLFNLQKLRESARKKYAI
jgi:hypothetical protein